MREIPLVDNRYAPWPRLHPSMWKGSPEPWAHGADVWAKRLTGYDPTTDVGWEGDWAKTINLGGTPHLYVPPCVGAIVRVSGDPDAHAGAGIPHKCVRILGLESGTATVADLPDADAIQSLQDTTMARARLIAHNAVATMRLEQLAAVATMAENDAVAVAGHAVGKTYEKLKRADDAGGESE